MTVDEFITLWHDTSATVECHTSGSTGKPKPILLTKHDMAISARATNAFFGLGKGSVFVCPMSFDFIGARMMAVRAELCGGLLITPTPSNRFSFEGTADLLAIVPSQIDDILDNPAKVAQIRNVIIGGAPLNDERRHRIVRSGLRAFTTYGMTETASHVALARVTDAEPVYKALDGVRFSTDDRDCLVIDMPGRDADHIVTNDIVRLTGSDAFTWIGRADNVINSGGIKIHPEIIEAIASKVLKDAHIPFTALVVKPVTDSKWGNIAVLEVETDAHINDKIYEQIAAHLDDRRKAPKRIITTTHIPRTPSGKILRH